MTIWTPALEADKPAYQALADAVARDRASGALAAGARLPPHRTLAYALGLTVGTITRGYAEAARRGLVRGEVGRGTFVTDPAAPERAHLALQRRVADDGSVLNLTITRPALDMPLPAVKAGLAALAAGDLDGLLDYGPAEGKLEHRAAIADWLRRPEGGVQPERVIVASGAQNALALAAAGLFRPGDAIAVDPLTYPGFKTAASLFGLTLTAAAGDMDGMTPDALEAAAKAGARGVYLMPTIHNPTMATMPLARRHALAAVAEAHDLLILEDDVYGFLAETPPPRFADLAPERTALIGSISKFMGPALRVGWIAPPLARLAEVSGALRGLAWMASPLLADVVATAMASGEAQRLADRQRQEAAARMVIVRAHLGPWLPNDAPPAAMHVWLPLPEPWRADAFVAEAEARRIAVSGSGAFAVGRARAIHAIRFGLGAQTRARLEQGMATLAALLETPPRAGAAVV